MDESTHIDRRGARGIIADEQDCILFIGRHATPDRPARWILPGGGIDHGESMAEAAARELLEETGLHVAPADLAGPVARQCFHTVRDDKPWTQENHFFFVRAERFSPRVSGGDAYEQDLEFNWIAVDDLLATDGLERIDLMLGLIKRLLDGEVPAEPVQLEPTSRGNHPPLGAASRPDQH
ncbi:NUDIX domain-containing protein [Glycomyces buryatensis]|uniref:NUDIX domain-containing protein n=1 Tax=Glycomyces buryatensis TaxID=2570927 RepID=UPI001B3C16FB|nr:NUDIX hydrolase [Glycomyces buryatensis]